MQYRREIDGLRAIAVLPVILFHADFTLFGGGYVGVDVFFVISGYLITTIIIEELQRGRFSLISFYERRARRILPALFLVVIASIPFAYLWLNPRDLKDFFQSIVAVSVFSSNVLFWLESGYFEAAAELKPLLHTWSLAVEEQYYVVFPLLLAALWRYRKRWVFIAIAAIAVLSFSFSLWSATKAPMAGFFLLPARAWELMIGALTALLLIYGKEYIAPVSERRLAAEISALVGLALIGFSVFAFSKATPFPSFYALYPTIGTAMLILFATKSTTIGRALGNRALVGVGLISYSAYLWHQPMFAFARHRSLLEPSAAVYLVLSAAALGLAYVSWRFIESPFRNRKRISRSSIFTFAVAGSFAFLVAGTIGHLTDGLKFLNAEQATFRAEIEKKLERNNGLGGVCNGPLDWPTVCRTDDHPEVVVWGDSYAMHLIPGLLASNPEVRLAQWTKHFCGPIFGLAPVDTRWTARWAKGCIRFNERVARYLTETQSVRFVVLSSPFAQYLKSENWLYRNGALAAPNEDLVLRAFLDTLERIEALGIAPIIFSPPPITGEDLGQCLAKADLFGESRTECNFGYDDRSDDSRAAHDFLKKVQKHYRVVWLKDFLCDDGNCLASAGGRYFYRDDGHLSIEGSAKLGQSADFYSLLKSQ